jgi:hypothetical protein
MFSEHAVSQDTPEAEGRAKKDLFLYLDIEFQFRLLSLSCRYEVNVNWIGLMML